MEGTLTLHTGGGWKHMLPVYALTVIAFLMAAWVSAPLIQGQGTGARIVYAIAACLAMWGFYTLFDRIVPWGGHTEKVTWQVNGRTVRIGEETVELDAVRSVNCWPRRDTLGIFRTGWLISIKKDRGSMVIETEGKDTGAEVDEFLSAIGYEGLRPDL